MNARSKLPLVPLDSANVEETVDIAIIGTGFSGLGMAIRLRQTGHEDFAVFEKADSVGGTWRDNHYPGCACDVQSHVYSFSFAPNPNWTRMFAPQPEIRAYLEDCAQRFGVYPHLRFDHELVNATYDEAARRWRLAFANGRRVVARVLVSGMGGLSRAALPDIPGIECFNGEAFHSQHWNHDYPLEGKRVAVIGTGASAIQFVPQIAPRVARLSLFQRTPPWIMPKPDRPINGFEQWLFRNLPFTQKLLRGGLYWMLESRVLGFAVHPSTMKLVQKLALRHLHRQISEPELRAAVTPDYTIGCKRILLSNDYYPALTRKNVDVVTTGIERIEEDAVVTKDGKRHEVDCLIYGTGFQINNPFPRGTIVGRDGVDVVDAWRDGLHAYLGATVPGYPNWFILMGPNTGLGHNSMVYMIESQIEYVLGALKSMRTERVEAIDVRPIVEHDYNDRIQTKLKGAVWSTGGCNSWYLDPKTGRNTTLWPDFTWRFRQETECFSMSAYQPYYYESKPRDAQRAAAAHAPAPAAAAPAPAEA
ncbi:flavin-containing monooxygenase [Burkholderia sp. TSV86]|uniref:flavin-containing monooxygenase n=1 Tax=Burkholderia sp. TSV86 TaxID=1385594 RepID=UPI00075542E3|nr:NAD(P)/FAD-dependent oxidoreductase [Burkholderia sp. TSV86]KVE32627.1 4-hydroxyacetophenone monooxygenase [Burkholderia sp. TSV86]